MVPATGRPYPPSVSRIVVASKFVWSDYPGLRVGRLYAGQPDLPRLPNSDTHVVDGEDAARTVCGLDRTQFPHEFPEATALGRDAKPCAVCCPAGDS